MQADRRWCLTATPIHNRLDDLAALIEFLKIDPFHGKSSKAAFRRYIMDPLTSNIPDPCHNLRVLLRSICLRRTKLSHSPIATSYNELTLKMNLTERQLYNSILEQAKSELDLRISTLPAVQKYARLFTVLLKLRMVCNLGTSYRDSSAIQSSYSPSVVSIESGSDVDADISCDLCQGKEFKEILVEEAFCPSCLGLLSNTKKTMSSLSDDRIEQFESVAEQKYYSCQDNMDGVEESTPCSSVTRLGWPTKLYAVANNLAENMCNSKRYEDVQSNDLSDLCIFFLAVSYFPTGRALWTFLVLYWGGTRFHMLVLMEG